MILDYQIIEPNPTKFVARFVSKKVHYIVQIDFDPNFYIKNFYHFAFLPWPKDTTERGQGRDVYDTSFAILEEYLLRFRNSIKFDVEKYSDETQEDVAQKSWVYINKLRDFVERNPDFTWKITGDGLFLVTVVPEVKKPFTC